LRHALALQAFVLNDLVPYGTKSNVNPKEFFGELKRRNVYKVAIAYAVVAWLLIQIATQVFPFFEIPNWTVRLVVLLIAIGFPIALIIAWASALARWRVDLYRHHRRGAFDRLVLRRSLHGTAKIGTKNQFARKIDRRAALRQPESRSR
jgi:hypothetical protein